MNKLVKNIAKTFSVLLSMVLVLTACGGGTTSGEKVLRMVEISKPNSLNHTTTSESVNFQIIGNTLEGLMTYDKDGKLVESLAESHKVSEDGLIYTFKLRSGLEWSNGTPITANDFVFGWRTLLSNQKASYASQAFDIVNAEAIYNGDKDPSELGAIAIDDKTLEVTLIQPRTYFLAMMAFAPFFPLNEEFYTSVGGADGYGTSLETVLGNGPFTLTEYAPDTGYQLTKNPKYWNAKSVNLDKVQTRIVTEPTTYDTLFGQGDLDRLPLTADLYDKYKTDARMIEENTSAVYYMYISADNGGATDATKNADVREAIALSIDKSVLTNQILKNGAVPTDTLVPKGFDNLNGKTFREYAGSSELAFDQAKALEAWERAKTTLGTDTIDLTITIGESSNNKLIFESVESQIETTLPGVNVTIETMPSQSFFPEIQKGNTVSSMAGWGADYIDVATYFEIFRSTDKHNYAQYNNPQFDELLDKAKSETDAKQRWNYYVEAEQILVNDHVIIPLFQNGLRALINDGVEGLAYNQVAPQYFFKFVTKK